MEKAKADSIVTPDIIANYQDNGFVCLRNVFEKESLKNLCNIAKQIATTEPEFGNKIEKDNMKGAFFHDVGISSRNDHFRNFVAHSGVENMASSLLESEVELFFDQILVKDIGALIDTPWHQDITYWPLKGDKICSFWIPLDAVDKDTCLKLVNGSHRWGEFNPRHFESGKPFKDTGLPEVPDIDAAPEQYQVSSFDMALGDCIIFDARTLHSAPGNASDRTRAVLSVRWMGKDVEEYIRPGEQAI